MRFGVNLISVLIAGIFSLPVLAGFLRPFSKNRIQYSLVSMIHHLEMITAILVSVFLANLLFTSGPDCFPTKLFRSVPAIWNSIVSQDIWAYILAVVLLLLIVKGILRLLMIPFSKHIVMPAADRLAAFTGAMRGVFQRTAGGLWQLPKSVALVLFFSLLLNFYVHFANNSSLSDYIRASCVYKVVADRILDPMLDSSLVQKIPGILNESVQKAVMSLSPNGRKQLIYFNGMALDDAVRSSFDLDAAALQITGSRTDIREKAGLLYDWVSTHMAYDTQKAEKIFDDPSCLSSGAVEAFKSGKGICFDIACLYAAMCRASGISVRLVTGLGRGSTGWGSHSWNQVYDPEEDRWLNVDATFGCSGKNYFDSDEFHLDHKDAVIQGEW